MAHGKKGTPPDTIRGRGKVSDGAFAGRLYTRLPPQLEPEPAAQL